MATALTITHLSIADWIVIAVSSGFAAAVFNQLVGGLLAKFQRASDQRHQQALKESEQNFQARMQEDTREHESLQLLIKSHFEQRDRLLQAAIDSYGWLDFQLFKNYGDEYEVYERHEPTPKFETVADVISSLKLISQTHPTRSVRQVSRGLKESISAHYSTITGFGEEFGEPIVGGTPSVEQLTNWLNKADDLIELMHEPPSLDEVRHSTDKMSAVAQPPLATPAPSTSARSADV